MKNEKYIEFCSMVCQSILLLNKLMKNTKDAEHLTRYASIIS